MYCQCVGAAEAGGEGAVGGGVTAGVATWADDASTGGPGVWDGPCTAGALGGILRQKGHQLD